MKGNLCFLQNFKAESRDSSKLSPTKTTSDFIFFTSSIFMDGVVLGIKIVALIFNFFAE